MTRRPLSRALLVGGAAALAVAAFLHGSLLVEDVDGLALVALRAGGIAALAGGVAAALLRRTRTGEGALVDVSLLGTAMWCMQMSIAGGAVMMATAQRQGPEGAPPMAPPSVLANPLVNNYRTSDNRWLALCMLQRDVYWDGLFEAVGRADLLDDPRFADPEARTANSHDAAAELERTFAGRTLAEWRDALAKQPGQWDVVQNVLELPADPQAIANGYVQPVAYDGLDLPMVSAPAQVDRTPPALRPAPEFNADADDLLLGLGLTQDEILQAKISGALA